MKRRLIPYTWQDRLTAVTLLPNLAVLLQAATSGDYWWALFFLATFVCSIYCAYWIQDPPPVAASADEYGRTIARVEEIKAAVASLSDFLDRERQRVAAVEATVTRLNEQKQKLEPVVAAQRQTVEAILSAYTAQTARSIWKERTLSFILGVVASMLASFVYEILRK